MREETKAALLMALETACEDSGEVRFYADYSGRGMYGRQCVGISGGRSDCRQLITQIIQNMAEDLVNEAEDERGGSALDTFNDAVEALLKYDQDSMGHDVILYWTHVQSEPVAEVEDAE